MHVDHPDTLITCTLPEWAIALIYAGLHDYRNRLGNACSCDSYLPPWLPDSAQFTLVAALKEIPNYVDEPITRNILNYNWAIIDALLQLLTEATGVGFTQEELQRYVVARNEQTPKNAALDHLLYALHQLNAASTHIQRGNYEHATNRLNEIARR